MLYSSDFNICDFEKKVLKFCYRVGGWFLGGEGSYIFILTKIKVDGI